MPITSSHIHQVPLTSGPKSTLFCSAGSSKTYFNTIDTLQSTLLHLPLQKGTSTKRFLIRLRTEGIIEK